VNTRYANIDLFRTIAIVMVVFFHAVNMSRPPLWFWKLAETGSLGVDLFFVLSGFLIGTLYFKEHQKFGSVSISRFIGRRIFRTVPMYWLFMPLAYLPVFLVKKTPFDWQYLFFLQNYIVEMPFYVISWSLCVEEHFYLILPFVMPFFLNNWGQNFPKLSNFWKVGWYLLILFILLTPSVLRTLNFQNHLENNTFGYYHTATHFRYEGLLLGVVLAAISIYKPLVLQRLISYKNILFVVTPLLVISTAYVPEYMRHSVYYTLVALFFALTLGVLYVHKPIKIASHRLNHVIAISSYSTYLVHSLVIHAWVQVFNKLHIPTPFITAPIMFVSAFLVGYGVYYFIEKKLMVWRDVYVPARGKEKSDMDTEVRETFEVSRT
jgi:peptidoglycan/LPS O-acetylase OafA/YrhL